MKSFALFSATALIFFCQIAFGGALEEGIIAFEKKNDKNALSLLKPLADKGSPVAQGYVAQIYGRDKGVPKNIALCNKYAQLSADQGDSRGLYNLGASYFYGEGFDKNINQALLLFQQADEKGSGEASFSLGLMYAIGNGITKDLGRAKSYYEKSATLGNDNAQLELGNMFDLGSGVTQDNVQAAKWFQMAAEQGNSMAQNNLANSYSTGKGVDKDFVQAAHWYRKAAEQGNSNAQSNLGFLYYYGKGLPKDRKQATIWFQKAAAQGDTMAQKNLEVIKSEDDEAKRKASLPKPDENIIAKCSGYLYGYTKFNTPLSGTNQRLVQEANDLLDLIAMPARSAIATRALSIGNGLGETYFDTAQNGNMAHVYFIQNVKNVINNECAEYGKKYGIETVKLVN